jgi:hypothetical protein
VGQDGEQENGWLLFSGPLLCPPFPSTLHASIEGGRVAPAAAEGVGKSHRCCGGWEPEKVGVAHPAGPAVKSGRASEFASCPPCSRLPLAMSKEISMEVRRDSTIYRRPRPGSAVVAVRSANIHTHKRTTQHNGDRKVTATVTPELLLFKFWFRWRRRGRLCRPNLDDNLRIFGILRGGSERRRTGSVH